ncbi:MAG TPA: hypothetical protein VI942_07150 [Thermoanaerobaculia bacterium]|nr:hypothetical protein [Thermoanaerobaculia bacterium]
MGEESVFRTISASAAPRFRALFEDGLIDELVRRGLFVESRLHEGGNGDGLVVSHRRIAPLSYPHEWPYTLLCSAALQLLDAARVATRFGRTLVDGHPWNVVIEPWTRSPVFVDLGSFWPIVGPDWLAEPEFLRFTLHPLGLMAAGQRALARLLLAEDDGVGAENLRAFARGLRSRPADGVGREQFVSLQVATLDRLARRVESLRGGAPERAGASRARSGAELVEPALRWLDRFGSRRIVDLSATLELTAPELARGGRQVVALTRDENVADRLVEAAEQESLPLLPLVIDPVRPTPARGVLDYWQMAATERLRADAVVAFGTVEAIVRDRRLTLDHAVEALAQFAPRLAIVGSAGASAEAPGVDRARLRTVLARRFARIEEVPASSGAAPLLVAIEARPRSWDAGERPD